MSVKSTIWLPDGEVQTFYRETMLEAIQHAEEVYYPMGAIRMDFEQQDKKEGGGA